MIGEMGGGLWVDCVMVTFFVFLLRRDINWCNVWLMMILKRMIIFFR